MSKQIEVYTLEELKQKNLEAFEYVHKRWAESVASSGDIPWTDETMDSLKAVVEACGGTLNNWQIGAYSQGNYARVSGIDDDSQTYEWFLEHVLKPNGYWKDDKPYFPVLCKFTGYCADDDFLESVCNDLIAGETLTRALENLADVAGKMFEDNTEQQQDEESLFGVREGTFYTIDGEEV